jgi:hypothetical protein
VDVPTFFQIYVGVPLCFPDIRGRAYAFPDIPWARLRFSGYTGSTPTLFRIYVRVAMLFRICRGRAYDFPDIRGRAYAFPDLPRACLRYSPHDEKSNCKLADFLFSLFRALLFLQILVMLVRRTTV